MMNIIIVSSFHFTDLDHCMKLPCLHGGNCSSNGSNYSCSCPTGFQGVNCEQGKELCCFVNTEIYYIIRF